MLRKIKIENFRGFKSFELNSLGRLNLLVGTNNSGKTSILEAIQLLCSPNGIEPLIDITDGRGEYFWNEQEREKELDISHLFHGHSIQAENKISVLGFHEGNNIEDSFVASIGKRSTFNPEKLKQLMEESSNNEEIIDKSIKKLIESILKKTFEDENSDDDVNTSSGLLELSLRWKHGHGNALIRGSISNNGGLSEDLIHHHMATSNSKIKTQFVTAAAITPDKAIELFDRIVLTPEENILQEALQTIEPKIERIASVGADKYRSSQSRGGFLVRLSGHDRPVPIGSMGDGIWRMLGLALAAVGAENGYLFIDEIDTGLHYSTMSDMWKMIWETAKRLNIQVFATTHSNDCWNSLASIGSREDIAGDGITIQRIERDKNVAVAFNEREIVVAADRGIEVR